MSSYEYVVYDRKNLSAQVYSMKASRQFRIYDEKFGYSLQTAHGIWEGRRSIILREENDGGLVSYGEVAPTPGFADCRLEDLLPEARAWAKGGSHKNRAVFLSALSCLSSEIWHEFDDLEETPVLSSGLDALGTKVSTLTSKKKIGIDSPLKEIDEIIGWISSLPDRTKVRLDANGSLTLESLQLWVNALEGESRLEFIEQPLPVSQFDQLKLFSQETSVVFALDETIVSAGGPEVVRQKGWDGYYVIKPSLIPDWAETIRFIKSEPQKSIVSTVFESPFGYEAVCRCASYSKAIAGLDRSLFEGNPRELTEHHAHPLIPKAVGIRQLDQLWESL
jgi:o-succinylbenzoate synthase